MQRWDDTRLTLVRFIPFYDMEDVVVYTGLKCSILIIHTCFPAVEVRKLLK